MIVFYCLFRNMFTPVFASLEFSSDRLEKRTADSCLYLSQHMHNILRLIKTARLLSDTSEAKVERTALNWYISMFKEEVGNFFMFKGILCYQRINSQLKTDLNILEMKLQDFSRYLHSWLDVFQNMPTLTTPNPEVQHIWAESVACLLASFKDSPWCTCPLSQNYPFSKSYTSYMVCKVHSAAVEQFLSKYKHLRKHLSKDDEEHLVINTYFTAKKNRVQHGMPSCNCAVSKNTNNLHQLDLYKTILDFPTKVCAEHKDFFTQFE